MELKKFDLLQISKIVFIENIPFYIKMIKKKKSTIKKLLFSLIYKFQTQIKY